MILFYSETKKIKYFLDPPPPQKRRRDANGRDMATRTCVCLYQQPMTWIFTRSRLSDSAQRNPFIKKYYLIVVAFSHPHFSIFHTKESTLSFNGRATHFKSEIHECFQDFFCKSLHRSLIFLYCLINGPAIIIVTTIHVSYHILWVIWKMSHQWC